MRGGLRPCGIRLGRELGTAIDYGVHRIPSLFYAATVMPGENGVSRQTKWTIVSVVVPAVLGLATIAVAVLDAQHPERFQPIWRLLRSVGSSLKWAILFALPAVGGFLLGRLVRRDRSAPRPETGTRGGLPHPPGGASSPNPWFESFVSTLGPI